MLNTWRDIPGWVGLYQASAGGDVRSLDRIVSHMQAGRVVNRHYPGVTLVPHSHPDGHLTVALCLHGRQRGSRPSWCRRH
jgi:NUMOD4 motif